MIAIHWSPVHNTSRILKNGIRKSKRGLFCFPLTGYPFVDRWWCRAFRQWRPRTHYTGFLFRITEADLPATFSHWCGGAFDKPLTTLNALTTAYRDTVLFRIGERAQGYTPQTLLHTPVESLTAFARMLIDENPQLWTRTLTEDPQFLHYIFEDYQLVLSHSIAPQRILKVISDRYPSGSQIARHHKYRGNRTTDEV